MSKIAAITVSLQHKIAYVREGPYSVRIKRRTKVTKHYFQPFPDTGTDRSYTF